MVVGIFPSTERSKLIAMLWKDMKSPKNEVL